MDQDNKRTGNTKPS